MSSTEFTADLADIQFVLQEWLHAEQLSQSELYKDFDAETVKLLVQEGIKFAVEVVAPTRTPSDREGVKVIDESAIMPEFLHKPFERAYELGWANLNVKPEYGGQGAPIVVAMPIKETFAGANIALLATMALSEGVARLIETFGTPELKATYIKALTSGRFGGTMCLSEPQAGSDVGANATTAEAVGDGSYRIKGTKCWITGGDQNLTENIVHTVLARIKGAPEGTKGLSLFLVPKYRLTSDGSLGASNDVVLASIEHKMGMNASPTCVLNFGENDDCYGYLLGEINQGMAHMFQLMNEARLGTGMLAVGVSSSAYLHALAYAKERVQGSSINELKNPNAPRVRIIEHPDVRLNLSHMKARVEAMRALLYGTGYLWDQGLAAGEKGALEEAEELVSILMPMCKGWSTEVALDVVRTGIQVLGGVGYTKDFPLEQLYRDLRVSTIYEGTTGIQALDLVGRKMTMRNGELFMKLLGRFNDLAETQSGHPLLGEVVQSWAKACERMTELAMGIQNLLGERGMSGAALYATPFMMFLGGLSAGYFYLQQAITAADKLESLAPASAKDAASRREWIAKTSEAQFYDNKIKSVRFYVQVVLPSFESPTAGILLKNFDPLEIAL